MKSSTLSKLAVGSALALHLDSATAQLPPFVDQANRARQRQETERILRELHPNDATPPEFYAEETSDVGPQSILRIKPRKTYFEAFADSQYFYTSNMFFQENDPVDTGVLLSTAQVAFAPPPMELGSGRFSYRAGYQHQWFNYGFEDHAGVLNNFDFDAATVFASARYQTKNYWAFGAGIDWVRLLGHEPASANYDEFYKEYLPHWSVQKFFPINAKMLCAVGYLGSYHFSEVDPAPRKDLNDRWDHVLLGTYTYAFNRHWVAQPYYRLQFSHYTHARDRQDLLHTFGLSLNYFFTDYLGVRAFASYDLRESNDPVVPDYRKVDAGMGINLTLKF